MINVTYGVKITGDVNAKNGFTLDGSVYCATGAEGISDYTGSYEVTPNQNTQTLLTQNKRTTSNITVNPIPSNYGLITWNGSVITVS